MAISSETVGPIRDQKTVPDRFLAPLLCGITFGTVRFDFSLLPSRKPWFVQFILADHFGQSFLVLSQAGLEIDFDAAVAEDLDGGFGKLVGNENFGSHIEGSLKELGGAVG